MYILCWHMYANSMVNKCCSMLFYDWNDQVTSPYVTFEGHVSFWYMYGNSMVIKSCSFFVFWIVCAVMWGLYLDHSSATVGHTCVMCETFLFRGFANNVKCMPAFQFTLLIALNSYEECILIQFSHICTWTNWHMWFICVIWGTYYFLAHIWE